MDGDPKEPMSTNIGGLETFKSKLSDLLQSLGSMSSDEKNMAMKMLMSTSMQSAETTLQSENSRDMESQGPANNSSSININAGLAVTPISTNAQENINIQANNEVIANRGNTVVSKRKVGRPRKNKSNVTHAAKSLVKPAEIMNKRKRSHPQRVEQQKNYKSKLNCKDDYSTEDDQTDNNIAERENNENPDSVKKKKVSPITERRLRRRRVAISFNICNVCSEVFIDSKLFIRHCMSHEECRLSCKLCRKEFYNNALFGPHKCKVKAKEKACVKCDMTFRNQKVYKKHLAKVHCETTAPIFICKYCDKEFNRKFSMILHMKTHAESNNQVTCLTCGEFFDSLEQLSTHEEEHLSSAEAVCTKCNIGFTRRPQFESHVVAHTKYDCKICPDKYYYRKKHLYKHMKLCHDVKMSREPKKHECTECGLLLARPGLLSIHMRIHTGEKPIECKLCHLFFRTPKAYAKHKLTTTHMKRSGEMPKEREFMCELCGSSYYRKQALLRHMNASHFKEKLYQCPHCEFACTEQSNLKVHVSLHFDSARSFVCELCGSAFHTKKTLNEHTIYKHTEERKFDCEICMMKFKTKNSLARHSTTHNKDKPHVCICGTAFRRPYNLRRHALKVHGSDANLPPIKRVQTLDVDVTTAKKPIKTDHPKKRVTKPKPPPVHIEVPMITCDQVSTLSLDTTQSGLVNKPTENYVQSPHVQEPTFLEQLASAVEFGREEVVHSQPLVQDTDSVSKSLPQENQVDPKHILYKWPPPVTGGPVSQSVHLPHFGADNAFPAHVTGFYPMAVETIRYVPPVNDPTPREQYPQEVFTIMHFPHQHQN